MTDERDEATRGVGQPHDPTDRPLPPHLDPRRGSRSISDAYRSAVAAPGQPVLPPAVPRSRRWARALSWVAVVTSVAVLGVSGAGYALVSHYDGQIDRIRVFPRGDRPAATSNDAMNVLLVGSDSRGNLAPGQGVQGTGADFVTGQRSDTVILAHLYGGRSKQVELVSFPRDAYVEIPAGTDPKTGKPVPDHYGKLNSAIYYGGQPLLIQTIERLTDVHIDHYVQIDFDGFKSMVDTLGGVEVCLPRPAKEHDSGIDLPAGRQTISGDQALAFVRQRKGLPNGDLDRIRRQQQFIGAITRKVLSAGTLANPFKVNGFLNAVTRSVTVDDQLTTGDMTEIALRLGKLSAGGVAFTTTPVTDINGRRKNLDGLYESVVLLDKAKDEQLFTRLRQDIPPQSTPAPVPSASPAPVLIVAPGNIRVQVYNASGVAGLGAKAASDLASVGFSVPAAAQTRGTGATATVVRYGPTRADSARTLAAAVPGAQLQADPTLGSGLELVVGSSYSGARQVTVRSTPSQPPSASASPQVVTAAVDPCAV